MLDRLLHPSHVITIRGDSYRLKEKRRSGPLRKPAAPETQIGEKAVKQAARTLLAIGARFASGLLHFRKTTGALPRVAAGLNSDIA